MFRILRKLRSQKNRKTRNSDKINLMIRDVMDLEVYKESLTLLRDLYGFLLKVPKTEYDSVKQLKRAGKSISAEIAEGFAKRVSELEFKRFLMIAIGSSDEVISHLRALAITVPRLTQDAKIIAEKYRILSKRLNKLHSIWKSGNF